MDGDWQKMLMGSDSGHSTTFALKNDKMLSIVRADSYVRKKLPSVGYPGAPRLQKHSAITLHPTTLPPA